MSLTARLHSKRPVDQQLQALLRALSPRAGDFYTLSGKKAFSKDYELLVPYGLHSAAEASLVGTAFDYFLRLETAKKTGVFFKSEQLVAVFGYTCWCAHVPSARRIEARVRQALKNIDAYQREYLPIYEDCFLLAKLKAMYRSGRFSEDVEEVVKPPHARLLKELRDLQTVAESAFLSHVETTTDVKYNPSFGLGSELVNGADGDIIIDGLLVDFKTSKKYNYSWQDTAQIVGYYFLNRLNQVVRGDNTMDFHKVALYQARYGEMAVIDLATFYQGKEEDLLRQLMMILQKG